MNRDTNQEHSRLSSDPLGIKGLSAAVKRLSDLKTEPGDVKRRMSLCIEQLEEAFQDFEQKHEMLKDRYALLKRSNSQLADEVSWLRDQIDDLDQEEPVTSSRPPSGSRRYSDRWPK